MSFDWQTIAVALIILAACFYVARRAAARLRSMRVSRRGGADACETGCGSCGGEPKLARATGSRTLVQIDRSRTHPNS
jgi:hypothetical protein